MSPEEVMDGDVPLAGKLKPVAAVPPVCVELSICKTYIFLLVMDYTVSCQS
jgi:hypothetical protein